MTTSIVLSPGRARHNCSPSGDRKSRDHVPKVVVFGRNHNTTFDTTLVTCFPTRLTLH
jgi:hypothetical protein